MSMQIGNVASNLDNMIQVQSQGVKAELTLDKPVEAKEETKKQSDENKNEQEKKFDENSVQDKTIIKALEEANKKMKISGKELEYSIHEKTKRIMVKVVNSDTKEVIKEIPNEKIVDMLANMWETAGLLVDEKK